MIKNINLETTFPNCQTLKPQPYLPIENDTACQFNCVNHYWLKTLYCFFVPLFGLGIILMFKETIYE